MKLRHILVEQKYIAEDVLKKLSEGKTFESLAASFSQCASSKQGGDLGDVPLHRLDITFKENVENLKVGERTGIFRTRFGYHIAERY